MIATPIPIDVPLRRDRENVIRIGNTRVTLRTVIADFHRGASPEEIVHHYPALNLPDVYLVIGYYLQNRDTVDAYVQEQRQLAEAARRDVEADYGNDPLRANLLARLKEERRKVDS